MKINNIILGLAAVFTTTMSIGQLDRSIAPSPGPAPEISIADPVVFDMDNGMKVILSTNTKIPKVSFNIVMGSDPRLEGEKTGLSEMLGGLLLSGTTNRTKDELDFEKDFIGAQMFASSNSVYLNVMTKHIEKGLDLFVDVIQNANFPESEFERLKKQISSGLFAASSDANVMIQNITSKIIFTENHPYGEVITEEHLENITRDDIAELYKKQFTPAGSYLVIVGDINEEEARKIVNERFGSWEGGVPFEKDYHHGVSPEGNRVAFAERPGAVQSVINIAFPVDILPGDDDQIKLEVLNSLFGGRGFSTRLIQNLREDKGYTYGAYSFLDIDRKGSYFYASGSFRNEVTDSAIVEFINELEKLTTELPTHEELNLIKATMAGSFARSLENPRTIASFALNTYRNNLSEDYYKNYLKMLEDVSQEDILEMAQKYITPNNLNIIVVGNKEVVERLKQFDADGEIELFDAFGNPTEEKSYLDSDLSANEVIEKYLMAITQTKNMKKAEKKINKIKTLKKEITLTVAGSPMEMQLTESFKAPNISVQKMTFSGMTIQEEVFNGDKGVSKTMNQTGGFETTEMTEEEVKNKRKTASVFPEYSLLCCNAEYLEILGIEERKDKEPVYVVQYKIGDRTTTNYYSTTSFLKVSSHILEVTEEGPQSITTLFNDYTNYSGYLFPKETTQLVESVSMSGKISNIEINKKIDDKIFKVE